MITWSISSMIRYSPFFWSCRREKPPIWRYQSPQKPTGKSEKLAPVAVEAIKALGDRHALNRSLHSKMHLNEIDILRRFFLIVFNCHSTKCHISLLSF